MWESNFRSPILAILSIAFLFASADYSDVEVQGISCPARDKCRGYAHNLTYMDRNCECDYKCVLYKDCCIDAPALLNNASSRRPPRTNIRCINYGEDYHSGVYAVSTCSRNWSGDQRIRKRCVDPTDLRDPLIAAPATDVARRITYRNLACAQCNNADLANLETFQVKLGCDGVSNLTDEEIYADLTYHETYGIWGVNRNTFGRGPTFHGCDIIFEVPGYLNNSVRFCRSGFISSCAPGWERDPVADLCAKYMAVVYQNDTHSYRNPHCAICNNQSVNSIYCNPGGIDGRKRPMSFALLLDVNQSDGDQVGMRPVATPQCASGHKYDPFFKKCRQLVCALPGHTVVGDRCVRG